MTRWRCGACGRLLCDHRVSAEPPRMSAKPPKKVEPRERPELRLVEEPKKARTA